MKANSDFKNWLKSQQADEAVISTSSILLDRVFQIPIGFCTLLRSEPYAGATAVLLQLVQALTKQDYFVVYCDIQDNLLAHRLHGIDLGNLNVIKPITDNELLSFCSTLALRDIKPVYILDNINFIEQEADEQHIQAAWLAQQLKVADPNCTVICSRRKYGLRNPFWDKVVDLKHLKNIYSSIGENDLLGHLIEVSCETKKQTLYIEHITGRISMGYEAGILEMEKGTLPSGTFSKDGITVRGFHKFVEKYDEYIRSKTN